MTDRSIAPAISIPQHLSFPEPQEYTFANGLQLSAIHSGNANVVRLSLVCNAGTCYQQQAFIASATLNMLREGTKKYSSAQLAEQLDFYGSTLDVSIDRDFSYITVYALEKYFGETLEIFEQLVKYPTFPQSELDIYIQKNKERLVFERQRIDKQAGEIMATALYGTGHPYGAFGSPDDYKKLDISQLKNFHQHYYSPQNMFAVLSGNITNSILQQVEHVFGNSSWGSGSTPISNAKDSKVETATDKLILKEKKDSLQSAIRMGKVLFNRNHPDYNGLTIVNTVLGGYFGSRLMKNIREEKGYTYGIYSILVGMKDSGYLTIATQTGSEYTRACIDEVKKELLLLQNKPISTEELTLVKNYVIGDMLRSLDGPWMLADVLIDLKQSNLPYTQVNEFFNEVKEVTPDRLQSLAQSYLSPDDFVEVVVGQLT